jgi:O-antigen/teichoic acid export membrane protein
MQLLLVLPVQALLLAAQSLLVPYLARLYANKDQTRIRRQTSWLAAGFTVGAVAVSTLVIIVGNSLVELVFGASYARFANLLIPVAAAAVFSAARAPYTAACRALQNARGTFVIQAGQTIVTVPLALLGAVLWDAVGAAWGIAAGSAVLFVSALLVYRQTVATVLPARDAEHSGLL